MLTKSLLERQSIERCSRILARLLILSLAWEFGGVKTCQAQSNDDEASIERKAEADKFFKKHVSPFIKEYCLECHQNRRPTEAGLSFTPALDTPGHAAFSEKWKKAAARVKAHDMPPADSKQPTDEERQRFSEWMEKVKYLSTKDPGPFVIRRLTKTEYANTLRDLFGVDPKLADALPDEVSGEGYLNSLSPLQIEQYLSITEQVLNAIVAPDLTPPTEWQERMFGPTPASMQEYSVNAKEVARVLGKRIYRRPPTEPELDVLVNVFELRRRNELSYSGALRLMLKAMLVSPQFLFITPSNAVEGPSEIVRLDDYQLASRLSYFLWGSMPDDELLSLAGSGTLHEPTTINTQVARMLADPRSRALFDGFGAQWLGVGDLKTKTFDPIKFPEMTEETRTAMYEEVRLFFERAVRENHSIVRLIDSEDAFLNESLAILYGREGEIRGSELRSVLLNDKRRGGILGMPGVLAATSFPNRTSPVHRGVWVLEQLLGEEVPSAPPDVPALDKQDQQSIANRTLRERFELHRADPNCATCHRLMDPIGFGLENFGAIGRWRERDENGEPIDATGELPDGSRFSNPLELKAMIVGRRHDVCRNLVKEMLSYALCRKLQGYDEIVLDQLMRDIAQDGYRMQTIVTAVVTSYLFTHRRTK